MSDEPTPHTAARILICEDEIMLAKDMARTLWERLCRRKALWCTMRRLFRNQGTSFGSVTGRKAPEKARPPHNSG